MVKVALREGYEDMAVNYEQLGADGAAFIKGIFEQGVKEGESTLPEHLRTRIWVLSERIDELMTAIHVARGALFNIGGEYAIEVAAKLGETLERATPAQLQKRPVAWRVQGDEFDEWILYDNEMIARQEAEARDVQYQGLYVRTEEGK